MQSQSNRSLLSKTRRVFSFDRVVARSRVVFDNQHRCTRVPGTQTRRVLCDSSSTDEITDSDRNEQQIVGEREKERCREDKRRTHTKSSLQTDKRRPPGVAGHSHLLAVLFFFFCSTQPPTHHKRCLGNQNGSRRAPPETRRAR